MRKFSVIALLAFFPCGLLAARLTLRDGTVIYGQFLSGSPQTVVFRDDSGVRRRFDLNQVQTIDFNEVNTQSYQDRRDQQYNQTPPVDVQNGRDQYGQANREQYGQANRDPYNPDGVRNDRQANGRFALLQPGTRISVRTDQNINSQSTAEGALYPASIAQDVIDQDGRVVIPRGSRANLVIRRINEGGTLSNGSFLLDLDTVQVEGHTYRVAAGDVQAGDANGIGKNRRTGEMVGGGAVLGTLLGAIAGGGKGAAIGAVAGAAAGGGVEVATKGHEIRVPAETILNFRLERPLELREVR